MSEPRTDQDVERALTAWVDQVAPARPPMRLLEGTFVRTTRTRQTRAFPWNRISIGPVGGMATGTGVLVALVALVVLVTGVTAFGFVAGGLSPAATRIPSPSPTLSPTPGPSSALSLPAAISVAPQATIPVQAPIAMVARGPAIWALAPGRLDLIDPTTNAVTASVTLGGASDLYNGLAANTAGLWATDWDAAILDRVNPATLKVAAKIPAGLAPKGVLATPDGVWVADTHGGAVLRFDPATNKAVATTTVGPTGASGPNWLAVGLGSIWVDIPNNGTVVRIDPATNKVQATIAVPTDLTLCGGIAVGTSAVWITSCATGNTLARIDPASNRVVATIDMGGNGYNPTLINDAPWISVDTGKADSGVLVRIDPATNRIDRVLVPRTPFGGGGDIVVAAGSVWVVDGYNNSVVRLPLTAFAP